MSRRRRVQSLRFYPDGSRGGRDRRARLQNRSAGAGNPVKASTRLRLRRAPSRVSPARRLRRIAQRCGVLRCRALPGAAWPGGRGQRPAGAGHRRRPGDRWRGRAGSSPGGEGTRPSRRGRWPPPDATGHRLERHKAPGLPAGGKDDGISVRIDREQVVAIALPGELDAVIHPQAHGERAQSLLLAWIPTPHDGQSCGGR